MSELLDLASRLRALDTSQLADLLRDASVSSQSLGDLFDLARALLGKRALESRIRQLHSVELELLRAGQSSAVLVERYLASEQAGYPQAIELANQLEAVKLKATVRDLASDDLTNYETQLAITELLFACERHWLEPMKQGLRAPDLKQLTSVLKIDSQRLQLIFQLALQARLITQSNGRYVASPVGSAWLESDPAERWLVLASEIMDLPDFQIGAGSLFDQLLSNYPLLEVGELQALRFGHLIGLISELEPTALLKAAIEDLQNASQLVADQYPQPATRMIVQGDLTITSPGPISTALHRQLDLVANSEDLGLACRFRVSTNSVLHALETGMSADEVLEFFESIAGGALPQPLQYLIAQAKKKFGELVITETNEGSRITSTDPIVLMQIQNESGLRGLMLRSTSGGLESRLSSELVYFNLRDHGYPAIMVDSKGAVISPRAEANWTEQSGADLAMQLASALISSEAKAPDLNDHLRQLQFALKNKLKVGLRVEMPEGVKEFEMIPLGISAGRFRGRDTEKEAERTLPLSRIQSIWLS